MSRKIYISSFSLVFGLITLFHIFIEKSIYPIFDEFLPQILTHFYQKASPPPPFYFI